MAVSEFREEKYLTSCVHMIEQERARFQLFGDTMNTAGRMVSSVPYHPNRMLQDLSIQG